jgi:hypothetical protein
MKHLDMARSKFLTFHTQSALSAGRCGSAERCGSCRKITLCREMWLLPGDVALSCNPSYWEARIVGWLMGGKTSTSAADGFCSRTKATYNMV